MDDTQRLDFILKYFSIDDIGDEFVVRGVCINSESLELDLTYGKSVDGKSPPLIKDWNDNLRDIIDRAILAHTDRTSNIEISENDVDDFFDPSKSPGKELIAVADALKNETITDGFGNHWSLMCPECNKKTMVIVRPGKVQCMDCG